MTYEAMLHGKSIFERAPAPRQIFAQAYPGWAARMTLFQHM